MERDFKPLTAAERLAFKQVVGLAMDDPTLNVELFRGMEETSDDEETNANARTFEPTAGKTIVLHLNGGANNVRVQRIATEDDEKFIDRVKEQRGGR